MKSPSHGNTLQLDAELASLQGSIAPERDLWPDIEQAIGTHGGIPWTTALAAAVLLVVVTAVMTTAALQHLAVGVATTAASYSPASTAPRDSSPDSSIRARDDLRLSFEQRLPLLAPKTREAVLASLDSIHRAEFELRRALAQDPSSTLLQNLNSAAARRELALYLDVVHATDSLTRRT